MNRRRVSKAMEKQVDLIVGQIHGYNWSSLEKSEVRDRWVRYIVAHLEDAEVRGERRAEKRASRRAATRRKP